MLRLCLPRCQYCVEKSCLCNSWLGLLQLMDHTAEAGGRGGPGGASRAAGPAAATCNAVIAARMQVLAPARRNYAALSMTGQLGSLAGRATPVQPAGPFCGPARRRPARAKALEARTWALQAAAQEAASPPAAAAAAAAPQPPAAPATSHPQVRPIQPQPAQLTPEGLVPNTASLDAVPPALQPLLEAAVATCRAQLGRQLVGVYARGSLVQAGCFVPGLSDADFLALYLEDPSICSSSSSSSSIGDDGDSGWRERDAAAVEDRLRRQAAQMQQAFPQCVKVRPRTRASLQHIQLPCCTIRPCHAAAAAAALRLACYNTPEHVPLHCRWS